MANGYDFYNPNMEDVGGSYYPPSYEWPSEAQKPYVQNYVPPEYGGGGFDWSKLIQPGIGAGATLLGSLFGAKGQEAAAGAGKSYAQTTQMDPTAQQAAQQLLTRGGQIGGMANLELLQPGMTPAQEAYYGQMAPQMAAQAPGIYGLGQDVMLSNLLGGGFPSMTYGQAQLPYQLLNQATQQQLAEEMASTYGPWFGRSGGVTQALIEGEAKRKADLAQRMSGVAQQFAPYEARMPEVQTQALTQLLGLPSQSMAGMMGTLGLPRTMAQAQQQRALSMMGPSTDIYAKLLGLPSNVTTQMTPTGVPSTMDYMLQSLGGGLGQAAGGWLNQLIQGGGLTDLIKQLGIIG